MHTACRGAMDARRISEPLDPERDADLMERASSPSLPEAASGAREATRFRAWWSGPNGYRVLAEFGLCLGLFYLYRTIRMVTRDDAAAAFENARDVMRIEQAVGIFNEERLQDFLLGSRGLIEALNRYYVSVHFTATTLFLMWAFVRHRDVYRTIRYVFIFVTAAALVIHVMVPLAPPRMFPATGFVDTLRVYGPRIYTTDVQASVVNQFAAVPSLHFGWAVLVAGGFVAIKRSRRSLLAFLHPFITLVAIVATGNHYWFDAAIALVLVLAAVAAVRFVRRVRGGVKSPATRAEGTPELSSATAA